MGPTDHRVRGGRTATLDQMPDVIAGLEHRPLVPGHVLLDDAADLAVAVPASCRRTGRCHECVVEVRAGADQLTPPTEVERFLAPGFRLACQARIERAEADVELAVLRRRLRIQLAPDTTAGDLDPAVRAIGGRVTADDGTELGPVRGAVLGVAIDVGTTTVVLELVDLETGGVLAVAAFENPQRFGGSDVMTRISYDAEHPGELRQALRRAVNHELRRLCAELRLDRRQLVEAYLVGNPTMRDLAFGLDVSPLGTLPYRSITETAVRDGAAASTVVVRRAHELGLLTHPQARVIGGPLIASHVGADAAADLVAVGAPDHDGSYLLVDIGTNTEVLASDGRRVIAASGPAGPAFEGGGVRYGMPGAVGAIEAVRIREEQFDIRIIGGAAPEGICGSGLVDLLAELRRARWMTTRGGFTQHWGEIPIVRSPHIGLDRADIGHLSVAKAATAVGQRILLRRLGLRAADLEHAYLAGGFANALDVGSAVEIGLLVPVAEGRVVRAGNAAIAGARALLLSRRRRAGLERLIARIEHAELETAPDFFELFTDGCLFEPIAA